jgi:hypothetical protein
MFTQSNNALKLGLEWELLFQKEFCENSGPERSVCGGYDSVKRV